jgi:putative ABC transport system ATP-binding protein
MYIIELNGVNVSKNGKSILKNINLKIIPGEKILIKGDSGSGKSTLIKTMMLFERFSGFIYYQGQLLDRSNFLSYRRNLGYVGQVLPNFDEQVNQCIMIPFSFKANSEVKFSNERMLTLLEDLNFNQSLLKEFYSTLSGGEKQRVLILQTLLLDRSIYFFDEITSSLDQKNIEKAVNLITANPERTVISISHNSEWEKYCSRVLIMDQGELIREAHPEQ